MPTIAPQTPRPGRVYFFLVLTTFFWGGSFLFNKIGLREVPPAPFVLLRFGLATLLMLALCARRLPLLTWPTLRRGAIVGLALGATNLSFVFGVRDTSISRAGVLNNLFVLFIPLLCKLIWHERIGRINLAGLALAGAGIWLLATGGGAGFNRGDLVSTVCALFIACHILTVSKVLRDDDIYLVSLAQFAVVTLLAGLATLAVPSTPFTLTGQAAGAIVYCAIFPTLLCFTLQNRYQRYTTPTQAGLVYTLDPVWSLLFGFVFLAERLSGREWLGCGLIFTAVVLPLGIRLLLERQFFARYRTG
jgi:drug/metabolite transporter (DMT)-like permease